MKIALKLSLIALIVVAVSCATNEKSVEDVKDEIVKTERNPDSIPVDEDDVHGKKKSKKNKLKPVDQSDWGTLSFGTF